MSRKFPFITTKILGEFNQELRTQTKGFLTKFIYNKYRDSDQLREMLKNIIGDIWKEIRRTYGINVWNIVRFYLKGGTAIIETLQYYIKITKNDQLSKYLRKIIDLDLFQGQQSDWDTTMYINPSFTEEKFYEVQAQLADIVFGVYVKHIKPLSDFFNSDRDNLRVVLTKSKFEEVIIKPTIDSIEGELKAAIAIKDKKTTDDLTKKLENFKKSKDRFLKHINNITYDLTTNTSYLAEPNIEKLGPRYKFLANKNEDVYSKHLYKSFKSIFGCVQRLPWMKDFNKFVTSNYAPVLLSVNRTIMNQKVETLQEDSKHHFDLFRFMLCYSGKITWNRNDKVEEDLGFSFPYYFFDYQAELVDISTLNYYSHENNKEHWDAASISRVLPIEGISEPSWRNSPKTPFPISNFIFAIHDLVFTLRDKGKLKKRCARLFILFNIICAMNRQLDLEQQFQFKSILEKYWNDKDITECQEGLKELQKIIYNESDIAVRTLLATPNINSSTCSAIFPQLRMPDCDINDTHYTSDKLLRHIYEYVEGVIEIESLQQIPSQNLCVIMQTINREIPDYQVQKNVAVDIFTRLRLYNLQNLNLGDWEIINEEYIMLPFFKKNFEHIVRKFAVTMYNSTFNYILKNINTLLPINASYIGPVVNRGTIIYKTLGNNADNFKSFVEKNNITVDGFYEYGMEFDLWETKGDIGSYTDNFYNTVESLVVKNMESINRLAPEGFVMISPLNDEENIKKNWQFLSPGLYEKIDTILRIGSGAILSKNVGNNRTTIVISVYTRQKYFKHRKSIIIPHIIPIVKINIMRQGSLPLQGYSEKNLYKIPEIIVNGSFFTQKIIYYKSYLETIKINIRNKINSFPPKTSPFIKAESVYLLCRFFCGYYNFLQSNIKLAQSLSIVYNEKSVVDVCAFSSNPDNFKNTEKAENFYQLLDRAIPTSDRLSNESLNINSIESLFSHQKNVFTKPVLSIPESIKRKPDPEPEPKPEPKRILRPKKTINYKI